MRYLLCDYILASQSPRRRELLARTGLEFDVIPSDVNEKITKEVPSDVVMELAHQKAENVYAKITDPDDYTVIGSDTIVVYRDEILENLLVNRKPTICCPCLQTAHIRSTQVFH